MRVDPSKVFIDNQADLDHLMADAMGAPWVSVDTEFERIRTFFPRLCLIQMATPQWTVCIDPLADITLSGVGALLASAEPVKIFHAARQDMDVLGVIRQQGQQQQQHAYGEHRFDEQSHGKDRVGAFGSRCGLGFVRHAGRLISVLD